MKKTLKLTISMLLILITSCSEETLYEENFEHRINGLDNSEIFLNTLKTLQLEVFNVSGKNQQNSTYHVSFEKLSGDLDVVFDQNQTLIEGEYYELKNFNEKKDFQINPKTLGNIQLKVFVKNNNEVIKSRRLELIVQNSKSLTHSDTFPDI